MKFKVIVSENEVPITKEMVTGGLSLGESVNYAKAYCEDPKNRVVLGWIDGPDSTFVGFGPYWSVVSSNIRD